MKRIFILTILCVLTFPLILLSQQARPALSGNLTIFHAGSLAVPMKDITTAFNKLYPNVKVQLEAAGSVASARKITDLNKPCDIMASADYAVIDKMLIPKYADWNIKFVSNELTIMYTPKSRYASQVNAKNWMDILLKNDVTVGRADPNADPCGYRTVLALQLAEQFYRKPGLAEKFLAKDLNYMRPKEVDLIALLESGSVDYVFIYKSVAVQHEMNYITLPDQVNLKNPAFDKLYASACTEINGKEPGTKEMVKGEAMVYGITLLKNAPNKPAAMAFIKFLLSKDMGMKILLKDGQPSVIPMPNKYYQKLPLELRPFAIPGQ